MSFPAEAAIEAALNNIAILLRADMTLPGAVEANDTYNRIVGHIERNVSPVAGYGVLEYADKGADVDFAAESSLPVEATTESGIDDLATLLLEDRTVRNAEDIWQAFQEVMTFIRNVAWPASGFGAFDVTPALVLADFNDV